MICSSVTIIGSNAFGACTSLTSLKIPDSVTEIGECAFDGCHSLTKFDIPDSVTEIPAYCFRNTGLKCVHIHKKIKSIGNDPFSDCPIEHYYVDAANEYYMDQDGVLFDKSKKILIKFPAGKEVCSFQIPDTVEELCEQAFQGSMLYQIQFSNELRKLGDRVFADCKCLEEIDLPKGIDTLPFSCFIRAQNLQKICLPSTIKHIEDFVFEGCIKLREIHLHVEDPQSIVLRNGAFHDFFVEYQFKGFRINQCSLFVPIGTEIAYRHHPEFGKFKEVIIER